MRRTYVPFHYNKAKNTSLFYDFEKNEFFTSPGAEKSPFVATYSGMIGVVIYALFKDLVINLGGNNPLYVVGFSLIISLLVFFAAIWGIQYFIKKNWDKTEIVEPPSKKEMPTYIQEGEKWLNSSLFIILFIFIFTLVTMLMLFFDPDNLLLFGSNTILWAILLFVIWGIRPLKRKTIYNQFKNGMDKMTGS